MRFSTNFKNENKVRTILTGKDQTIPKQVSSITEIIYRFQGGIIPNLANVNFDPIDAPEEYINVVNKSGFDITDAFHALQSGKQEYRDYMKEKNEKARKAVADKEAELIALREFKINSEQQQKQ